jgi:alkanesulfonate monooxygenase SsuD/methylene tetrahydromethanopterin reductase-like flavin-dependent oxidoreductase (luciferase family)
MTFGEITDDPVTGTRPSPRQRVRETIEMAQVADDVGLDVFGIGEHHRSDFIATAPAILLAAAAEKTKRVRLTSSVTVLSSEDPVRLWEQFATIDLLSGGRAEIIAGRGSYTESFPLFGYDLEDYADLFREKLDLLLRIREQNPLSWRGRFRPELVNADIAPARRGPRSRSGWVSADQPRPPSARDGSVCPWRLPCCSARSPGKKKPSGSTASRPRGPGTIRARCRSASTPTGTSGAPAKTPGR